MERRSRAEPGWLGISSVWMSPNHLWKERETRSVACSHACDNGGKRLLMLVFLAIPCFEVYPGKAYASKGVEHLQGWCFCFNFSRSSGKQEHSGCPSLPPRTGCRECEKQDCTSGSRKSIPSTLLLVLHSKAEGFHLFGGWGVS